MTAETTTDADEIRTGIESDSRADATAVTVTPDVWAFVDDGEFATSWAIEQVDDDTARFEVHRHEAGLDDVVKGGKVFEAPLEARETIEAFARRVAEHDPERDIEAARRHFA